MNKDKNKIIFTLFIIYEIVMICFLASDSCDDVFDYHFCDYEGFQYLVMCGFVPLVGVLIALWWKEILGFLAKIFGEPASTKKPKR